MTETFEKENDYTISIRKTEEEGTYFFMCKTSITRTFNFLSEQLTTITKIVAYDNSKHQSAAVSAQTIIQNFSDIPSSLEIQLMHKKLVDMGGHPPELSEIVPLPPKKNVIGR